MGDATDAERHKARERERERESHEAHSKLERERDTTQQNRTRCRHRDGGMHACIQVFPRQVLQVLIAHLSRPATRGVHVFGDFSVCPATMPKDTACGAQAASLRLGGH